MEDVEAVPAVPDEAERARPAPAPRRAPPAASAPAPTITAGRSAAANASATCFGSLPSSLRSSPSHSTFMPRSTLRADAEHLAALARDLADARGDQRRFPAEVGADQQDHVRVLDAGDGRVEIRPRRGCSRRRPARSAAPRAGSSPAPASSFFAAYIVSASSRSPAIAATFAPAFFRRLAKICSASSQLASRELALLAHPRPVEPVADQRVDMVARLVADPLLVHVLVDAREDAHHLALADVEADVRADRVHHVDARHAAQLPRPLLEQLRLLQQRADRAHVDQVAGELAARPRARGRS